MQIQTNQIKQNRIYLMVANTNADNKLVINQEMHWLMQIVRKSFHHGNKSPKNDPKKKFMKSIRHRYVLELNFQANVKHLEEFIFCHYALSDRMTKINLFRQAIINDDDAMSFCPNICLFFGSCQVKFHATPFLWYGKCMCALKHTMTLWWWTLAYGLVSTACFAEEKKKLSANIIVYSFLASTLDCVFVFVLF